MQFLSASGKINKAEKLSPTSKEINNARMSMILSFLPSAEAPTPRDSTLRLLGFKLPKMGKYLLMMMTPLMLRMSMQLEMLSKVDSN